MELGDKLRQARLDAGLTQRQLCGDRITRNMLSQIENGLARPSMQTLRYLAGQLKKPVSYFLEETAVVSANQEVMARARSCFDLADYAGAAAALEDYQEPDPVYDREKRILWVLTCQERAKIAMAQGKIPLAQELLEKAELRTAYCWEELERRRLLMLGQIPGQKVCQRLPSLDRELLLRAGDAIASGAYARAEALLNAAEHTNAPQWNLLRGQLYFLEKDYANAAEYLRIAEDAYPDEVLGMLEQCCRELEDYKGAYDCACKIRQRKR